MTVSKKRAMPVKGPYVDFGSNQDYLQKNAEKVFLSFSKYLSNSKLSGQDALFLSALSFMSVCSSCLAHRRACCCPSPNLPSSEPPNQPYPIQGCFSPSGPSPRPHFLFLSNPVHLLANVFQRQKDYILILLLS